MAKKKTAKSTKEETKVTDQPYTFKSGSVQSRDIVRVITQIDKIAELGSMTCDIMRWTRADGKWAYFDVPWSAVRLCTLLVPDPRLLVLGARGMVMEAFQGGATDSPIAPNGETTVNYGDMRDLRLIGSHVYAVGMSRQVYRRESPGVWTRYDEGVLLPKDSPPMTVAGFNAIDGLNEEDFFAVGFNGEIWNCKAGKWYPIKPLTHLILTRVRVIRPGLMYACGQQGMLLRGSGDSWEIIKHNSTTEDLWGMEWFNNELYVASDSNIYKLTDGGKLEAIDMGLGQGRTCMHLDANDGVMWSFGPKHLSWTDGTKWYDATP